MEISSYTPKRRKEFVAISLAAALQSLKSPADTRTVVGLVCTILETREARLVSRIVTGLAPSIPEAVRGETFRRFGREMVRWVWWPKGTTSAGPTRAAKRANALSLDEDGNESWEQARLAAAAHKAKLDARSRAEKQALDKPLAEAQEGASGTFGLEDVL